MRTVLGASRNTTFKQCRRKYKYRYIDKCASERVWPFLDFGSFIHRVLELWVQAIKEGQDSKEAAREAYNKARKEQHGRNLDSKAIQEAKQLLKSYMKSYLAGDIDTLDTEQRFCFNLDQQFIVRGILDRIDRIDNQTIEVIDYKTTKKIEYLDSEQLIIYTMAAKQQFGEQTKVIASYVLLRHDNRKITSEFTDRQLEDQRQKLIQQGTEILEEQEWDPSPSFLCDYCDYFVRCHQEAEFWLAW